MCGKYRRVRLLDHVLMWEKILERRLRDIVNPFAPTLQKAHMPVYGAPLSDVLS